MENLEKAEKREENWRKLRIKIKKYGRKLENYISIFNKKIAFLAASHLKIRLLRKFFEVGPGNKIQRALIITIE